jgi:hypothetical protein
MEYFRHSKLDRRITSILSPYVKNQNFVDKLCICLCVPLMTLLFFFPSQCYHLLNSVSFELFSPFFVVLGFELRALDLLGRCPASIFNFLEEPLYCFP